MFSVVEELSSPAFRKIAALVSAKRGFPKLPDLSDNPSPSYIYLNLWRNSFRYFYLRNYAEKIEPILNIKLKIFFLNFILYNLYEIKLFKFNFRPELLDVLKSKNIACGVKKLPC
jgi:hypothetical protein